MIPSESDGRCCGLAKDGSIVGAIGGGAMPMDVGIAGRCGGSVTAAIVGRAFLGEIFSTSTSK